MRQAIRALKAEHTTLNLREIATINIQRRMADRHFAQAKTWPELQVSHAQWQNDYNARTIGPTSSARTSGAAPTTS